MDIPPLSTLSNASIIVVNETDRHGGVVPFVSQSTYRIFLAVNSFGLTGVVSAFGVFSNTANVIVYFKMGLRETTNISFFALAVIDWIISTLSFLTVIGNISSIAPFGEEILSVGYHLSSVLFPCVGVGAWITTVLSAERCLCIVLPLKVKTIVTRGRIIGLIAGMAVYESVFVVLMILLVRPPYHRPQPIRVVLLIYSVSIPVTVCFVLLVFSTVFMVTRLRQSLTWRNSTSTQQAKTSGVKERRVVVSVVWICTVFIICYTPFVLSFVTALVYPKYTLWDPYLGWFTHSVYTFNYMFQTVSSSSNIIVYYKVSTRYREVFRGLFGCSKVTTE